LPAVPAGVAKTPIAFGPGPRARPPTPPESTPFPMKRDTNLRPQDLTQTQPISQDVLAEK
jgi:hypothetical protein